MTTIPALPFPVTPRRPGDPECDLFGFSLVHRALRAGARWVADAAAEIAGGAPCPPERHAAFVYFAEHVLYEIHSHHSKEDDVLWPVIATSAGPHIDLDPLTDDHVALQAVLVRADEALAVAVKNCAGGMPGLAVAMTEIADELDEHIEEEERTVFPVMRAYVSKQDFAKCEEKFRKGASMGHMLFMLPWLESQCAAEERANLLAEAPAPVKLMLKISSKKWNRRHALLVGRHGA